jgi:hypothetical protein
MVKRDCACRQNETGLRALMYMLPLLTTISTKRGQGMVLKRPDYAYADNDKIYKEAIINIGQTQIEFERIRP